MTNFFWVNQGATHDDEVAAGCLWAPERDAHGATLNHWDSMLLVQPGDVMFTYAKGHLRGYAVATSGASPMPRPYASGSPYSPGQGGRVVFCSYTLSAASVPFSSISSNAALVAELSNGANPVLNSSKTVAQKYLCPISHVAAAQLAALLKAGPVASLPASKQALPLTKTTVKQLVDARLGQGQFRQDLLSVFGGCCAVTGLSEPRLLRASHIKPWCVSSNAERLDPDNGVLLAAGIDAAFDAGFVGFDQTGALLVNPKINPQDLTHLGFPSVVQLTSNYLMNRPGFRGGSTL